MCGHVGVASKSLTLDARKAFYDMLHLDVLRGEDSTGVACITKPFEAGTEVEVFKSVGPPSDFFYYHGKNKRDRDLTAKPVGIMIGHNRFATQGEVNEANAHPFDFPNLVGAHNGTVTKWSLRDFHGYKDYDVDSQIIFSHLSHTRSIDEVWKEADGAAALVWWDKVDNKLNIIRNKERPLSVCYSADDKTVFWASEPWMYMVGAMRHNIKLKEPVEIKPNVLYTFSLTEGDKMHHSERELPPFVEKRVVGYYGSYGGNYDWMDDFDYKSQKKSDENVMILITEFNDIPHSPFAMGKTEDGSVVKINVPPSDRTDVRNKIVGRGKTNGYYLAPWKNVFSSQTKDIDWWCSWSSLRYISLKEGGSIVKEGDSGFRVSFEVTSPRREGYAPFFKGTFLTQKAWENKTECGCFNCLRVPNWGHKDELEWLDAESFLCADCKELPFMKDLKESA